jgi:hypothetical protein
VSQPVGSRSSGYTTSTIVDGLHEVLSIVGDEPIRTRLDGGRQVHGIGGAQSVR